MAVGYERLIGYDTFLRIINYLTTIYFCKLPHAMKFVF